MDHYAFERKRAAMEREFGCPIWTTMHLDLIPVTMMTPQHLYFAWAAKVRSALASKNESQLHSHLNALAILEQEHIRRGLKYPVKDFDKIHNAFHGFDYLEGLDPIDFLDDN